MPITTINMAKLLGTTITLFDQRTGFSYDAVILDAKEAYSKLRIQVTDDIWFEPTYQEAKNLGVDLW